MLSFRDLTLEDKEMIDRFVRKNGTQLSYYNFTCLYMWRKAYHYQICEHNGFLLLSSRHEGRQTCYFPLGEGDFPSVVEAVLEHFNGNVGFYPIDIRMKETFEHFFGDRFDFHDHRGQYDYVYRRDALASLAGKKLHGKRNHVNKFRRLYPDFRYVPLTEELFDDCLRLADVWQENAGIGDVRFAERAAIEELLTNYQNLPLRGGALLVDGQVAAFSIGEKMNGNTALIHLEKADTRVEGSFSAINQAFVEHAFPDVEYVNREEDMDLPGLRKAKLSYCPDHFNEAYKAVLRS